MFRNSLIALTLVFAASCAEGVQLTEDEERLAITREAALDSAPEWFIKLPEDPAFELAAGTGMSTDLQAAVFQALMNAKHSLADRMGAKLNGYYKTLEVGTNTTSIIRTERLMKSDLQDVDITGYAIRDKKFMMDTGRYRVFILLEYSSIANRAKEVFDD